MSLEDVEVEDIGLVNIIIGKNNTGKSSVFRAISFLGSILNDQVHEIDSLHKLATCHDSSRNICMDLNFELIQEERKNLIDLICEEDSHSSKYLLSTNFCSSMRCLFESFGRDSAIMYLSKLWIVSADNEFSLILNLLNPESEAGVWRIIEFANLRRNSPLVCHALDIDKNSNYTTQMGWKTRLASNRSRISDPIEWLQNRIAEFFSCAFFFSPFRHSSRRADSFETNRLDQSGSNLVQVLTTVQGKSRPTFVSIEKFLHSAVPDVGVLQLPLRGNQVEIAFRNPEIEFSSHIHEMGAGVEQLLMVGTVLHTTPKTHTLFLEEPESHLHPGAQRFLIEQLSDANRQVFITTHSPVLISAAKSPAIYRVTQMENKTRIAKIVDDAGISQLMDDIGVRKSDVLLSDAVLFVEGKSDRDVICEWARILGHSFSALGINVLTTGGSEHASRQASPRRDALNGISSKAPVPFYFVFDRDEKPDSVVKKLQEQLPGICHILSKRELENFLLVPHSILKALRETANFGSESHSKLADMTEAEIHEIIDERCEALKNLVILKRIRSQVHGLDGGLMDREIAKELECKAFDDGLDDSIRESLKRRCVDHINSLDLKKICESVVDEINLNWQNREFRTTVVPGEEILEAVYAKVGLRFDKKRDPYRIAKFMERNDLEGEIRGLIERIVELPGRTFVVPSQSQ